MSIDFTRLSQTSPSDAATEPRRIFAALPSKLSKYAYPRDVQAEVWEQWHRRREESDLLIKMNTGSGKTVVGLLILKSSLNERMGPCLYVVADNYLQAQVTKDAKELGLEVTEDPGSTQFRAGRAILIVNIHRLVNGLSVFGTSTSQRRINLGTILVDDVHACINRVDEQFTLNIPRTHDAYEPLLEQFAHDLESQSPQRYRGILDGDPSHVLQLPFWSWVDNQNRVLDILFPYRDSDREFRFKWPLIADYLHLCRVGVSCDRIQIASPLPTIDVIPTVSSAQRRIYMTATVPDNSILVTHFAADPDSISRPITPSTASDLGDRMILTPHDTHPQCDDSEIHTLLAEFAESHNVVVIVPSKRRAQEWAQLGATVYDKDSIEAGVDALRAGLVGLVVFVNKYDGIDLPDDACRILAIDGLPETYGELARLEELALSDTRLFMTRQLQRIEQGMGRGVRSNEDWCVVFLLGRRLTERIYTRGALDMFSPATRAQLELSRSLADQIRDHEFSELRGIVSRCLLRDSGWVVASRSARDGVTYDDSQPVSPTAIALRGALVHATRDRYHEAVELLREASRKTSDSKQRGWLKSEAAAYQHHSDQVLAQTLLASAFEENSAVVRPRQGVRYKRISAHADQAKRCTDFLAERYPNPANLVLGIASILEDLRPNPSSTSQFEEAWHQLGLHLGIESQRPERDHGVGPDVLWMLGDSRALVVECKSGATNDTISKTDAAQLGQSIDWFVEQYGTSSYEPIGVMIHKSNRLDHSASARDGVKVVTFSRLEKFADCVLQFTRSIQENDTWQNSASVGERLVHFELNSSHFLGAWALPPKRTSRRPN